MARRCGKYLTSNRFGVLAQATDGVNLGFFTTKGVPKNQTPTILTEPVLLFYLPHQFICHIRGTE